MCNSTTCGNAYLGGFSFPTRFLSIWQTMGITTRCFELRVGFPVSKDGKTWWSALGELADLAINQPPLNQTLMRRTCFEPQTHRRYCRGRRRPALQEGGIKCGTIPGLARSRRASAALGPPGGDAADSGYARRDAVLWDVCSLTSLSRKTKAIRSCRTPSTCAQALGDSRFSCRLQSTRPTSYMRAMRT